MNRWLSGPVFGLVAAVAVAVSACGNATTSTAGQPAEPSSSPAAPAGPPGATGTVAAVTDSALQVQNPRIGQVTVTFTPATSFTETVPATVADLVAGDCAVALGAPPPAGGPAGPVTAASVLISPAAADGGCTAGGFGGPGRSARASGPDSGAPPSRDPNQPSGAGRGRGATASGKIISTSGAGFVIQTGTSNVTRTVTTTETTTFTKTVRTDHSALAVGECVTVVGSSGDTGTVAASTISIRQPGPNGCQGGVGGPGRGRGRTGPGTGSTDGLNGA